MEVYCYVPAGDAQNIVECGLKLSRWADREADIGGERRKCITALLNPKDNMNKYRAESFKCLKLEVQSRYCFVADNCLYEAGRSHPEVMCMYEQSIMPAENYIFGSYRLPECLVISTVLPGQISILDKWLDSPILFDNSEDLYINNIIETYREYHRDFNDALLYSFYSMLSSLGRMELHEDRQQGIAVFSYKGTDRTAVIRIPDFGSY